MTAEHPLHDLAMTIRYDLTAAQGKLTELIRQIGELNLPEPTERFSFTNGPVTADQCWSCGVGGNTHTQDCEAFIDLGNGVAVAVARAHTPAPEEAS